MAFILLQKIIKKERDGPTWDGKAELVSGEQLGLSSTIKGLPKGRKQGGLCQKKKPKNHTPGASLLQAKDPTAIVIPKDRLLCMSGTGQTDDTRVPCKAKSQLAHVFICFAMHEGPRGLNLQPTSSYP